MEAERAARWIEIGRRLGEADGLGAAVKVAGQAARSYRDRHGAVIRTLQDSAAWSYAAAARPTLEMLEALEEALEEAASEAEVRADLAREEARNAWERPPLWARAIGAIRGAASGWRDSASRV